MHDLEKRFTSNKNMKKDIFQPVQLNWKLWVYQFLIIL